MATPIRRTMPIRRTAQPPVARVSSQAAALAKQLQKNRNAEPYVYYDTLIISANTEQGATAAVNFANIKSPTPFFAGRTEGSAGLEITNAEDNNKVGADFLATAMSIDVHCDTDCAGLTPGTGAGVATAPAFVELVTMFGIFALYFGTYRKYAAPVCKFPQAGGPYQTVKSRTQAAAANTESGYATNGLPTAQARRFLPEPILFEKGSAFRAEIRFPSTALTRLQALQALAGNFSACIRVNLEGIRGSELMPGTPTG